MQYDEWFNVLLNSDNLKNVCFTNKNTIKICSDKQFWIEKFNHDDLTIINPGNTINEWITEYNRVLVTTELVEKLLALLKSEHEQSGKRIEINFPFNPEDNLHNIITEEIVDYLIYSGPSQAQRENIELKIITFILYDNNQHDMAYSFWKNNDYAYSAWDENLSLDEVKHIMINIFYHYPNIYPYDNYMSHRMIDTVNYYFNRA